MHYGDFFEMHCYCAVCTKEQYKSKQCLWKSSKALEAY